MQKPNPVSLGDLSAAGIRIRPYEAVTIVRELVLQVVRHELAGVPSSHVIRLSSDGTISVEGPVGAGGPSVPRAAQLLDSLLPSAGAGSRIRVPGSLRLVLARAQGTLDLPPFESLEPFADALERFGSTDPVATVRNLVSAWAELVGARPPQFESIGPAERAAPAEVEPFAAVRTAEASPSREVTVSDIRRARRATGLALSYIARQSDIPLALLRQLEWGYFLDWPSGRSAETLLTRYARTAGLDVQLVLSTLAPMILEAERHRAALVPSRPEVSAPVESAIIVAPAPPEPPDPIVEVEVFPVPLEGYTVEPVRTGRWAKALAALAMPALLFIALVPAWWAYSSRTDDVTEPPQASRPAEEVTSRDRSATPPRQPAPNDSDRLAGSRDASSTSSERPAGSPPAPQPEPPSRQPGTIDRERAATQADDPLYRPASEFGRSGVGAVGTAMFFAADDDGDGLPAVVPARGDSRDAVLRITRIVDDTANNTHLRLSPDWRRIAFDSDRDGVRGVYVADRDGRNVRRVSEDGFAAIPSWSPDGRALAFARAEPARSDVWNLWTVDLDSGELKQITRHDAGRPGGASWFPDGTRLAYCHGDRMIVRNLASGTERVFTAPLRNRQLRTAVVSPDGRRIVFHVERDGAWLLELADGSVRRVLEDPTADEYTWSPDGRRLAYYSTKSGGWGVWVMASR